MTAIDLDVLGITKEELQDRVVSRLCESAMTGLGFDPEDGSTWPTDSPLAQQLDETVRKLIDAKIAEMAERHIAPRVSEIIEGVTLRQTNQWGEAIGKPCTFVEYLVHSAEHYMLEEVDREGRSQKECSSRGNQFYKVGSRIVTMLDRHLHSSIETAMKSALSNANSQIIEGIEKTCKVKLAQIAAKFKVMVNTE